MKNVFSSFLIFLICHPAIATMSLAESEANALSETMKHSNSFNVDDVPGYAGTNIAETTHNETTIETNKFTCAAHDDTFQMIKESLDKRPSFEIDMVHDPMIKASNKALTDSNKNKEWNVTIENEHNTPTIHTCTQGRTLYESKCRRFLIPHIIDTHKEIKTHSVNINMNDLLNKGHSILFQFNNGQDPNSINAFKKVFNGHDAWNGKNTELNVEKITSVRLARFHNGSTHLGNYKRNRVYQYAEYTVTTEVDIPTFEFVWKDSCLELENLIDIGHCEITSNRCVSGVKVKSFHDVPLSADCWEEEVTYQCHSNTKNTCESLLKKGCVQIRSECKANDNDDCLEWEKTFECYDHPHALGRARFTGKDQPFCLDGTCVDQSWKPNGDMADSLSKLSLFKEMQKDMDVNSQTIFKGKSLQCVRMTVNFKNCCVQRGWGKKIGLMDCSEEEALLAQQRKLNKCIMVGTYCSKKNWGTCTHKKTSFCCYQTKLARIINEQGSKQLGLSFGDPKNPKCDVLTLSHFTRLDFNQIDFSEIFSDIHLKTKNINNASIVKGIQNSLKEKSHSLNTKTNTINSKEGA
jgi:type-F conjugative transfer system mating-pair stabilization protein TraN